jgi:hypothetical protein
MTLKPHGGSAMTEEFKQHAPGTGAIYFVGGLVCWQAARDRTTDWLVRMDLATQPPMVLRFANEQAAQDTAFQLAESMETAVRIEKAIVRVCANGRELFGNLPAPRQPKRQAKRNDRRQSEPPPTVQ